MSETTRQKALIFLPVGQENTSHSPPSTPTTPHSPLHNRKISQIQTFKQEAKNRPTQWVAGGGGGGGSAQKTRGCPSASNQAATSQSSLQVPVPPQWPATGPWGVPVQRACQALGTHTATHHLRLAKQT